jgi:subtilase family serine protease
VSKASAVHQDRDAQVESAATRGRRRPGWSRRLGVTAAALLIGAPFLAALPLGAAGANSTSRLPSLVAIGATPEIPLGVQALGAVSATATETGMVVLQPRDETALTGFVAAVTDKSSALYHQYLAPGAYAQRFGPTPATIAAVKAQLGADGLHVTGTSEDGLLVTFSGTAATVESAFRTGIESYRLTDGTMGQATTSAAHVPSTIASSVAAVVGLDNLVHAQPADVRPTSASVQHSFPAAVGPKFAHPAGSPTPCALAQQDAETSGGLTDDQIANAYGAFGLYDLGDFGEGQHIAVYEEQPFLPSDIENFDTCYFGASESALMSGTNGDLSGSRLSITPVDGGELQPGPGSENDEATLDVEDVSAIAPEATINVYETPNTTFGGLDEYSAIVNSDLDQIVTSSWAVCEQLAQSAEPGVQQAENFLFEQAAAQGQTVLSAAGDTGDDECNSERLVPPPPGQNLLSVLDPSSQPYVVAVGGTTIDDATQPPVEHVWDDGAQWGAGGGGISESWQMPSWQRTDALGAGNADDVANAESYETATESESAPFTTPTFCDGTLGLSGAPCRETPDVSAQADEFTGSVTIYGQSLGYGNPNGWVTIGGTSSATPIWAALLALVNASSSCSGDLVNGVPDTGFASPILYGIAANPAAYAVSFNDIVAGNNDVYGLDNGLLFPARSGYDMASGLGSPQLTTPSGGNGLAYYMCQYGATLAPPTVTALAPTSGTTAGGETVTVTGTGFGSAGTPKVKSVSVGGGLATSFTVTSNTTLLVVLPAADATTPPNSPDPTEDGAGPAQIVVTSTTGQSSAPSAQSLFEYVDKSGAATQPSVTSLSPYGGLDTGPAKVTVFGSGFGAGATVDFGGVAATDVTVVSPFEITATPPDFSALTPATACPVDNGKAAKPLNPAEDVCQVEVTVTVGGKTSTTATILPPYEGPLAFDSMGGEVLPTGCGCEDEPQTSEYDYVPLPTVTQVSTGTPADLPGGAADLASEYGGASTNTVVVSGTGFDPLTLSFATLGLPLSENSIFYPEQESGTSMVLQAPALFAPGATPTQQPVAISVGASSLAGTSTTDGQIFYAGVPQVSSVVNTITGKSGVPDTTSCPSPPPAAGCGVPLAISGAGFLQSVGPIGFVDNINGFSLGTQNNYTVNSDTSVSTQSVSQNPALVDVELCTNTGCSFDPPADYLYVFPPGNPQITALSPISGPAHGGNQVTISGANLGCVVSVAFGTVVTYEASNSVALLHCGTTNQVVVTAPPGPANTPVAVTVTTVESQLASGGVASNAATYFYNPSSPSAPVPLVVTPGAAAAVISWSTPATSGGDANEPIAGYLATASSPGRPSLSANLPATARSYSFSYLQPGVPWTFSVQATSSQGLGLAATAGPTVLGAGDNGYIVGTANGAAFGFGSLSSSGGPGGGVLASPIVGIAATPDALGYFEAAADGTVYHSGDASYYGSATVAKGTRVVGIAATGDGLGYWLVTNTGAVFAFGDARYHGGASGVTDVVGIAPTTDSLGYYVVEANGKVTAYGNAVLHGDMFGIHLNKPLVGMAVDAVNDGYWLVGGDGGIFAFGGAPYEGSMIGRHLNGAAVGMVGTPDGKGYWIVAADNGVFTFGSARYAGNPMSEAESAGVGIVD